MSIEDDNGNEIVKLGTIHATAFRVLIWIGMLATPAAFVLFWSHSESIKLHEWRISALEREAMRGTGKGMSQSVNVGDSKAGAAEATARTWLTTKEVAEREKIDERTVINYIAAGQIEPPPVKNGKAWQIAEEFRIVPKDSESCGNAQSP